VIGMTTMQPIARPTQVGRVYGGFWRRGIAAAIDWLLIGMVVSLSIGYHGQLAPPHSTTKLVVYYSAAALVVWAYFAVLEACPLQATLGKLVLGMKVTTLDGRRIGLGRASARTLAKLLSLAPLGLGFVLASTDARNQALHDRLAATLVRVGMPAESVSHRAKARAG
jgi:uncharacterized RDD family membrane protein YckC